MSYLVLARKWRPKRFAELVGQEHVVRALTNALISGRVHHAFLFTGTRGVGKTTIARIFAKSLNCERGTSADPCGECETCLAIDAGRYIDLLEIDAASNTGVDNVRELIENAQYLPSRGRYKVYLIDEVHMLSKAAFNALLKTLEEPPEHVKFLFATTDPEKLLVTVLSRCLQFNLKRLDEQQITGQITRILEAEGIPADAGAIRQLAKAADGSLRDGLSLLDQAIAYTGANSAGGKLDDAAVATMLGTVDRTRVGALLDALAQGNGAGLLAEVAVLAEFSPDWGGVLDALTDALHRVQVRQLVPEAPVEGDSVDIDGLASKLRPEVVQLWYQMALNGRRDLPLAPSPRAGFEMSLLRMLAFRPAEGEGARAPTLPAANRAEVITPPRPAVAPPVAATVAPEIVARELAPREPVRTGVTPAQGAIQSVQDGAMPAGVGQAPTPAASAASESIADADSWHHLIATSGLRGPARLLAEHAAFIGYEAGVLRLSLPESDEHLKSTALITMVANALAPALGVAPQIRFDAAATQGESLRERNERVRDERQSAAETAFMNDPDVQRLIAQHGAKVVQDSIRPFEE
jgi:DNA polymerase-3 subunit gamma/tau